MYRSTPSWNRASSIILFLLVFSCIAFADVPESPDPVLVSERGSTRVLAVDAADWRGAFPASSTAQLFSGARIVVFVSNLDLLPGEGANAFRVVAEDENGQKFRFTAESLQPLPKRPWIYALQLRLNDPVSLNRQPNFKRPMLFHVAWRGNRSNQLRLSPSRVAMPDPDGLRPMPAPEKPVAIAFRGSSGADRKRFMEQASFGPTAALDFRLRQIGMRRWVEEQFAMPYPSIPYPNLELKPSDGLLGCGGLYGDNPEVNLCYRNYYWAYNNQKWFLLEAMYGQDQLRRRVSWALHQIWVVSENTLYQQRWMQEYIEILDRNAFGNFRDLMLEMTLSPGMGEYLDMVRSTRYSPNENYARELLQLFTIGLDQLNQDGTLIVDSKGNRVPTYDQETINNFTRVLTGWVRCDNGNSPNCPNAVPGAPNYIDPMHVAVADNHDAGPKTLLNYPGAPNVHIAPCNGCQGQEWINYANDSLNKAIDNIFHHPNVGPFIGKLLIQHLVTSDPSPAYVSRVSAAFNNNGSGVRGDMKAVIRAILLDPEARGSRKSDPAYGKLREPVQHLTNILRMFNVKAGRYSNDLPALPPDACQNRSDGLFAWLTKDTGQEVLYPPNVFSYFSPFAVVPGTTALGPEFALAHTGSAVARNNLIYQFTAGEGLGFDRPTTAEPYPWVPCGTATDLSEVVAWAQADPSLNTLIEGLNTKMMHGTMSVEMKRKLRAAISHEAPDVWKARTAAFLVASSSQYQIQR
jgi:uncharacterized protein (DUF1800 family)